jgi:hypothetical protein
MKKSKKIKLNLYQCAVHLVITDDMSKTYAQIHKKYNENQDQDGSVAEAWSIHFDMKDYYLIVDLKHVSINTIAHEVYHTVHTILENRDIRDEESGAWLCGMIMDEAFKFYLKQKENGIHRQVRKTEDNVGGTIGISSDNVRIHKPNDD